MDEGLLGRAVAYHGPDFLRQLQLEQQNVPSNIFLHLQKHRPQPPEISDPQFVLNVKRFVAKKADLLFAPVDKAEKSAPHNDEDCFAKMPPLETFMGIDPHTCRQHFVDSLIVQDIIVGVVTSIMESGLVLKLLCMDDGKNRDIDDLNVPAFVPVKEIPRMFPTQNPVEGYQMKDFIKGSVLNVNQDTQSIIVSLTPRIVEGQEHQQLGLIHEEDFPVQYRRKLHIRGLTFDELLNSIMGFSNPGNVSSLLTELQQKHDSSLMRGLHDLKVPEKEYANSLKKQQSQKWAYQSVAQGIAFFKEGKQTEAIQQLNKALQIDPDNVEALVARGALMLQLFPDHCCGTRLRVSRCSLQWYANNESFSRALQDFDKALKENPKHPNAIKYQHETLLAKGKGHEDNHEWEDAEDCYQKALKTQPDSQEAKESIRYVQYRRECSNSGRNKEVKPRQKSATPPRYEKTTETLKKLIEDEKKDSRPKRKPRSSDRETPPRRSRQKRTDSPWSISSSSSSSSSSSGSSSSSSSSSRSRSRDRHSKLSARKRSRTPKRSRSPKYAQKRKSSSRSPRRDVRGYEERGRGKSPEYHMGRGDIKNDDKREQTGWKGDQDRPRSHSRSIEPQGRQGDRESQQRDRDSSKDGRSPQYYGYKRSEKIPGLGDDSPPVDQKYSMFGQSDPRSGIGPSGENSGMNRPADQDYSGGQYRGPGQPTKKPESFSPRRDMSAPSHGTHLEVRITRQDSITPTKDEVNDRLGLEDISPDDMHDRNDDYKFREDFGKKSNWRSPKRLSDRRDEERRSEYDAYHDDRSSSGVLETRTIAVVKREKEKPPKQEYERGRSDWSSSNREYDSSQNVLNRSKSPPHRSRSPPHRSRSPPHRSRSPPHRFEKSQDDRSYDKRSYDESRQSPERFVSRKAESGQKRERSPDLYSESQGSYKSHGRAGKSPDVERLDQRRSKDQYESRQYEESGRNVQSGRGRSPDADRREQKWSTEGFESRPFGELNRNVQSGRGKSPDADRRDQKWSTEGFESRPFGEFNKNVQSGWGKSPDAERHDQRRSKDQQESRQFGESHRNIQSRQVDSSERSMEGRRRSEERYRSQRSPDMYRGDERSNSPAHSLERRSITITKRIKREQRSPGPYAAEDSSTRSISVGKREDQKRTRRSRSRSRSSSESRSYQYKKRKDDRSKRSRDRDVLDRDGRYIEGQESLRKDRTRARDIEDDRADPTLKQGKSQESAADIFADLPKPVADNGAQMKFSTYVPRSVKLKQQQQHNLETSVNPERNGAHVKTVAEQEPPRIERNDRIEEMRDQRDQRSYDRSRSNNYDPYTRKDEERFIKVERKDEERFIKVDRKDEERFIKVERKDERFIKMERKDEERFIKVERKDEERYIKVEMDNRIDPRFKHENRDYSDRVIKRESDGRSDQRSPPRLSQNKRSRSRSLSRDRYGSKRGRSRSRSKSRTSDKYSSKRSKPRSRSRSRGRSRDKNRKQSKQRSTTRSRSRSYDRYKSSKRKSRSRSYDKRSRSRKSYSRSRSRSSDRKEVSRKVQSNERRVSRFSNASPPKVSVPVIDPAIAEEALKAADVKSRWDSPEEKKSRWELTEKPDLQMPFMVNKAQQKIAAILAARETQISKSPPPHRRMKPAEEEAMKQKWKNLDPDLKKSSTILDGRKLGAVSNLSLEDDISRAKKQFGKHVVATDTSATEVELSPSSKTHKMIKSVKSKWDSDDEEGNREKKEKQQTKAESPKRSEQSENAKTSSKSSSKDRKKRPGSRSSDSSDEGRDRRSRSKHKSKSKRKHKDRSKSKEKRKSSKSDKHRDSEKKLLPDLVSTLKEPRKGNTPKAKEEQRVFWFHKKEVGNEHDKNPYRGGHSNRNPYRGRGRGGFRGGFRGQRGSFYKSRSSRSPRSPKSDRKKHDYSSDSDSDTGRKSKKTPVGKSSLNEMENFLVKLKTEKKRLSSEGGK